MGYLRGMSAAYTASSLSVITPSGDRLCSGIVAAKGLIMKGAVLSLSAHTYICSHKEGLPTLRSLSDRGSVTLYNVRVELIGKA